MAKANKDVKVNKDATVGRHLFQQVLGAMVERHLDENIDCDDLSSEISELMDKKIDEVADGVAGDIADLNATERTLIKDEIKKIARSILQDGITL